MQRLGIQKFFSEIRSTEIKADLMDDSTVGQRVKHRFQVASQRGSGTASLIVPTEKCLEMDDNAALQAVCCRLGLGTYPRLAHANQVPAELHSNGTACHTDR